MGFLSLYNETAKVDLGDGFYVSVRKFLTAAQRTAAEKKLINASMVAENGKPGNLVTQVDAGEYRLELAAQAIVDWNLTDEADHALPYSPVPVLRVSVGRLPTFVVDKIVAVIDDSGAAKTEDEQKELVTAKEQFPLVVDSEPGPGNAWPT